MFSHGAVRAWVNAVASAMSSIVTPGSTPVCLVSVTVAEQSEESLEHDHLHSVDLAGISRCIEAQGSCRFKSCDAALGPRKSSERTAVGHPRSCGA